MDVDVDGPVPVLNIQMSDVFNSDTEEDKNIQFEEENFEDDEHTVIYIEEVQEDEAAETECDDLFEETQDVEGLENAEQYYITEDFDEDIKETKSEQYENFCDRLSINEENNEADDVEDKYECIIIDPDDIKENDGFKETEESTASIVDEPNVASPAEKNSCDDDCVLISDDEEVPVKKPIEIVRKRIERVIVEATEETILKEFYFEEEDISIVDEQKIEGPKKTLVRRTAEGYRCPLYCTFTATDRPLMIAHLIKHKKSVVSNDETDNEAAYECPMCPFKTFTHSAFVYHITKHKKRGYGLVCSKCPFTAKNLSTLKQHITSIHALYIYCQSCPFKAKKLIALRKHEGRCKKAKKTRNYKLPCHFEPCPFTAATEEHLKTHEWIQHQVGSTKIRSYKCPQDGCYFDTIRKELFDEHVSMHTGEEMQCKLCNYKTGDFNSFKEHILTHISVP